MKDVQLRYPIDLVDRILDADRFPHPHLLKQEALPSRADLIVFLEQIYHASFGREEGRPPRVKVAFVNDELLNEATNGENPDLRIVMFESPRPFTSSEILKLAPAVNPRQAVILVQKVDRENGLRISGLAHVGSATWQIDEGTGKLGYLTPSWLGLLSESPGELVVSVAGVRWMTLSSGRIEVFREDVESNGIPRGTAIVEEEGEREDVLAHGVIRSYFESEVDSMVAEASSAIHSMELTEATVASDVMYGHLRIFLKRAISSIERARHGGTLCFGWNKEEHPQLVRLRACPET